MDGTTKLIKRDDVDRASYIADPDADPVQVFLQVMRHNAEAPGLVELYSRLAIEAADPTHPAHRFFAERWATMYAMMNDLHAEGVRDGRYPEYVESASFGLMLTALADGLQTLWLQDPTIDMADEIERLLIALGVLTQKKASA